MPAQLQDVPPLSALMLTSTQRAARQNNNPFQANYTSTVPRGTFAHIPQQSTSSQNTNPFRTPTHSARASESSSNFVLSPVSPVDYTELDSRLRYTRFQEQSSRAPRAATTMSSEPSRKSTDLRKLDGKPYPGMDDEQDAKPRKVKVAQDMYAGDMPPGYDPQGYSGPLASKGGAKGPCHKCGGHKKTESESSTTGKSEKAPGQIRNMDCSKCGQKKSMPPSSYPRSAMANAQPRSQAQGPPRGAPIQSDEAGPSGHRHKCDKCGRKRRPDSFSTASSSSQPQSPQAGLSIQRMPKLQTIGIPTMNIEPPTATTERAPTLLYSPATNETPLIKNGNEQPVHKRRPSIGRSGSISSLLRSLSRRRKTADGPLPSQQLASSGEQNSNSIVDKISHAIRDGEHSRGRSHPGLRPEARPPSPLSFVDQPREEQAFEMNDMRKSKLPERRNSWDKADEATQFLSDVPLAETRPTHHRSHSTRDHLRNSRTQGDDVYLSLPPDQRPGITRFKSLRAGVNRAAGGLQRSASQISRSSSLRRLESVKKVPSLWYRDDMALEGAASEYNNYAY